MMIDMTIDAAADERSGPMTTTNAQALLALYALGAEMPPPDPPERVSEAIRKLDAWVRLHTPPSPMRGTTERH
jgi:hypothetical protein